MPTALDVAYLTSVGTSKDELFAVDAGKSVSVNEVRATNVSVSTIVINLEIWPLDVEANAVRWWKDISLSPDQTFAFRGVRYMLATDSLHIVSDTASSLDAEVSWLEKATTDPAPTRNREFTQAVTSVTSCYTAPTTTRASVNDLTICNNSGSNATIDIELVDGATRVDLLRQLVLGTSGKDALYEHPGVINMLSNYTIDVTATNGVDVLISAQES